MLTVNSVRFYQDEELNGKLSFSGEFDKLEVDNFPSPAQRFTLALDIHCAGEIDGFISVRVLLGEQLIHETDASPVNPEWVKQANFWFSKSARDVVFPVPGLYTFDILHNNSALYSATLLLKER